VTMVATPTVMARPRHMGPQSTASQNMTDALPQGRQCDQNATSVIEAREINRIANSIMEKSARDTSVCLI